MAKQPRYNCSNHPDHCDNSHWEHFDSHHMVERCDAIGFDHARPCKFFGEPDVTRTIGSFTPKRDKIDQERDSRRNSEISLGVFHFFTERQYHTQKLWRVVCVKWAKPLRKRSDAVFVVCIHLLCLVYSIDGTQHQTFSFNNRSCMCTFTNLTGWVVQNNIKLV